MSAGGSRCTGAGGRGHCQPGSPEPTEPGRVTAWGFRPSFAEDMFNRYLYDALFRGQSGPYLRDRLPDTQPPGEAVNADARTPASPCDDAAKGAVTLAGDPVDYSNGNLLEYEYDFTSNGEMPLFLQRSYASQGNYRGIFGRNWMSNFDLSLVKSGSQIVLVRSDRTQIRFSPRQQPTPGWYVGASSARVLNDGIGGYVYHAADSSVETYNAAGQITSQKNARGIGLSFAYAAGRLVSVTHSSGRTVRLAWAGDVVSEVTDPAGSVYRYAYASYPYGAKSLTSVVLPGAVPTTQGYVYSSDGSRLMSRSINGVEIASYAFDGIGRAISSQRAGGLGRHTFKYTYRNGGRLTSEVTNPLGKKTTYQFKSGRLVSVTGHASAHCPSSNYREITYDANGYRNLVSDFANGLTDYDHDEQGRLIRKVEAAGSNRARETLYTYDGNNRNIRTVITGVSQTDYVYRSDGLISSVAVKNLTVHGITGQTRITAYGYSFHANGMLHTVVEDGPVAGNGDALVRTFDAFGNLLSEANSLGHMATHSGHNGLGLPARSTGANGEVVDRSYDARGRIRTETTNSNGQASTTSYDYDGRGRLIRQTDADGMTTDLDYDDADRLMKFRRPNPNSAFVHLGPHLHDYTAFQRDAAGNITRTDTGVEYLPPGRTTWVQQVIYSSFTDYDEAGRVRARRGNHGQNIRYTYDANGNVRTITDSLGNVTTYGYDVLNRVDSIVLPGNGGVVWYGHDEAGNVNYVADARGNATWYGYDGLGQLWNQASPDTGITHYRYNDGGQLIQMQRADGSQLAYRYDAIGRLTWVGTDSESRWYSYDDCQNGKSRLCAMGTTQGQQQITATRYQYNPQGQLLARGDIVEGNGPEAWTGYAYDLMGRRTGISYPRGVQVGYGYSAGALTLMQATASGTTQTVVSGLQYQPDGQLARLRYGNGVLKERHYDSDGRLLVLHDHQWLGHTLDYDANNRITRIQNWSRREYDQLYSYDALSRLTDIQSPAGNQVLAYDRNGNRTLHRWSSLAGPSGEAVYSTEPVSNRLLSEQVTYQHDARGNRALQKLPDGTQITFAYDGFNRLKAVNTSAATRLGNPATHGDFQWAAGQTTYVINALDQRVSKRGQSVATRFLHDEQNHLLAERKHGRWSNYLWLGNEPIAVLRDDELQFLHNDHLGRPEIMTNAANKMVWGAANFAFDRKVFHANIFQQVNLGFPGQYFDKETGFWHNGFRDYDSRTGTYLQPDPIGLAGGLNTYTYVDGEPVDRVDPLGLQDRLGGFKPPGKPPRIPVGTVKEILYRHANEMQAKRWIGSDKFYHCMAMCEAASLGEEEAAIAGAAGHLRELNQQYRHGNPREECDADRAANLTGLRAGRAGKVCTSACATYKPIGMPYP